METNVGNVSLNDIQSTLKDVKLHLHCIYELMSTGVKESRVATSDVKYLANQMGCHESIIDDNDCNLHELMGTIYFIKEEVHKLTNMNHCSHCQEIPTQDHPMEETFVVQQVHGT